MGWRGFTVVLAPLLGAFVGCSSHKPPPDAAVPERPPAPRAPVARLAPGPLPPPPMPRTAPAEMRGVWISDPRTINWPQAMEELHRAGFNTVFVNASSGGAAFHPSALLPHVSGHDELRACIEAARPRGIQVHAKFIVWYMFQAPVTYQRRMAQEKRLLRTTDGEILFQGDSTWLDPAVRANRDERLAAIREVLQNYPVDGVQLDYIRYPDTAGPMSGGRIALNTHFVADAQAEVRRLRPGIPLSVSNFYDYTRARRDMGQDWVLWAQRGYVDFLCPMNYTRDVDALGKWLQTQQQLVSGRVPLYSGIGAYMLTTPRQLHAQIALVRQLNPGGFVVFAYNEQFRQQLLPGLRF